MKDVNQICNDLRAAARFILDDWYALETSEAVRVGLALSELAGWMTNANLRSEESGDAHK